LKKDVIRDYATEAFRFYAAQGKPTYRSLKAQYMAVALEEYKKVHEKNPGISKPTEAAVIYAEKQLEKKEAELRDILAVEKVYMTSGDLARQVIEIVYFTEPKEPLKKGDITARVNKACTDLYISERAVYRILKAARIKFAEERGLRH
jgi:hypothetical protein